MLNIDELIRKYNAGQCSTEEKAFLEQWYQSFEWNGKSDAISGDSLNKLKEEMWLALQNKKPASATDTFIRPLSRQSILYTWWALGAAVVILLVVTGIVFYFPRPVKHAIAANTSLKKRQLRKEILPGTSKAQLVLDDGSTILLDSSKSMQFKEKDGTRIDKLPGKLVYNEEDAGSDKNLFNILSTPRGGEYQLVLPDGSKVWMNAASSLRFPTRFDGNERTVFLRGEAYFEVAKNEKMPFHVKLDEGLTVEVLGTHFNIMSYGDENEVRTTLEEGRVKVISETKTVSLWPSKQAVLKKNDRSLEASNADVKKALAWKNGMIEFDDDDLPHIMRQLSRWYDVDVSFSGGVPSGTYQGAIRRDVPLLNVLEILKLAGVKFKVDGNQVVITDG